MNAQDSVARRYNGLNKKGFMNAQDALMKHPYHLWLFAFVALLIHAYDASTGFSRGAGNATLIFTAYALFAAWAIFVYYKSSFTRESLRYLGVSLFAFALPLILKAPFLRTNSYVVVALTILPVWFLFIAFQSDNKPLLFTARLLVIGFALLLVIIAVGTVTLPDFGMRGVNLGGPFKEFWQDVQDAWAKIKERFRNAGFFNVKEWRQRINVTFNPYAQFYTGQVEENKQEPQGVFLTDVKSLYPVNYVGSPITLMTRLEAKTFLEEPVRVTPSCRLERAGKGGWLGKAEPRGPIEVNKQLTRDILCTFQGENVTAGTYAGFVGASFNFETWAYITNTFVSKQLIEQHLRQGRDINTELAIPKRTEAVYTNGPVEIGISASEQPIDVTLEPLDGKFLHQRFGFTLASRWSQGTLRSVDSVDILVPEPFALEGCVPQLAGRMAEQGFTRYTFDRAKVQVDPRLDYRTVTCELVLPDRAAAERVLAFGEKTPATFVVIARYVYELEKQLPVRVSE